VLRKQQLQQQQIATTENFKNNIKNFDWFVQGTLLRTLTDLLKELHYYSLCLLYSDNGRHYCSPTGGSETADYVVSVCWSSAHDATATFGPSA
jgi:hypothetical protein